MGNVVTQSPVQGHGVMQPAQGDPAYTYAPVPEQVATTQKVCSKCRTPIPPGSSMCPIHGKFGGGSTLSEGTELLPGRHTGEDWRRITEKRAAAASPTRTPSRHTPPEEVYPQMSAAPFTAPPAAMPQSADQRVCPNCNNAVPDRSKVCPTCGNNRLPSEKTRPFVKAEDRYKAAAANQQAYTAYTPQQDQFYGQPAMQPYEMAYPAPSPGFIEEIKPDKARKPAKKSRENEERGGRARQAKGSPLPILIALIALAGVIIMGVVFIMDQLKTPAPAVMPPSTTSSTGSSKAPVISGIQYSDITRTSATVTWKTDKKSNSLVIYCLDGGTQCENAKDDALVTDHVVQLAGLEQGKSYHITVKSMVGNSIDSPDASLEATAILRMLDVRDTTPPVISEVNVSNISSSVMGGSAEITWKTDEPATSQVSYGTSAGYGTLQPSQTDTTLAKFHDVILYGLAPQATFHYKVVSRDADGNERSSPDATFATPAAAGSSVGDSAPDFTLACADGSQVTLSALHGKKVIINFWNLQCHYCMEEMPYFIAIREKYPESSVAMLVINSAAGGFSANRREAVGAQITSGGYTFTVPLDEAGSVAQAYDVTSGIPVTFFVDSTGIIKSKQDGAFPSAAAIETRLNSY
jgi:peroxiredoxin/RNA polymerase subunit RPABC4/transcription elongation factor Spt4